MAKHGKKGVRFVDRDRGWRRLARALRDSIRNPHVVVGIYGPAAKAPHVGAGGSEGEGLTVAQIASIHEFGVGVPERSFIRGTVDARAKEISRMAKRLAAQVLDGRKTTAAALDLLGAYVHGQIIRRINKRIPPPLAASTIRRKGSSTPLVDKGQLKGSIAWEVRNA